MPPDGSKTELGDTAFGTLVEKKKKHLLTHPNVLALLEWKWRHYGKRVFFVESGGYLLLTACCTTSGALAPFHDDHKDVILIVDYISCVLALLLCLLELSNLWEGNLQTTWKSVKKSFDFWDFDRLLTLALVIACVVTSQLNSDSVDGPKSSVTNAS